MHLWTEAAQSKNGMLIFESDVVAMPDAVQKGTEALNELERVLQHPPDLFFLGYISYIKADKLPNISMSMQSLGRVYGTHAYYVSKKGAEILLKSFFPIEVQVDSYIGYLIGMKQIEVYQTNDSLYRQELLQTSIQTKGVEVNSVPSKFDIIQFKDLLLLFVAVFLLLLLFAFTVIFFVSRRRSKKRPHETEGNKKKH